MCNVQEFRYCLLAKRFLVDTHSTRTQYVVGMHRQLFSSFVETTGKQKYEFQVEVAHTVVMFSFCKMHDPDGAHRNERMAVVLLRSNNINNKFTKSHSTTSHLLNMQMCRLQ